MNTDYESFRNAMADIVESFYRQSMDSDSDVCDDGRINLSCFVAYSPIHGNGVFSTIHYRRQGTLVGVLVSADGKRTNAGRYINHSATPNVVGVLTEHGIVALLIRPIREFDEITIDYARLEPVRTEFANILSKKVKS
jgi:hypothetical protein